MKFSFLSSASMLAFGGVLMITSAIVGNQAHAAPINGSDAFLSSSPTVSGGLGDLLSATNISLGSTVWAISGATGDFTSIATVGTFPFSYGSTINNSALNLSSLGSFTFTSNDGGFAASSSLVVDGSTYHSGIVATSGSIAAGSESLTVYLVGIFTPTGSLSAFGLNNASETISFTETGIKVTDSGITYGSFSENASFAAPAVASPTPPPTSTPEPESMMLLGAGLIGLGVIRRRQI